MGAALIELRDVTRRFDEGAGTQVLSGISLDVASGESVAIVGPSGAGKSTLLNMIGGLDQPTTGSVSFRGRDIAEFSDKELARYRNQDVGFVFQSHHLLPQCSALENVLVPTLALPKAARRELEGRAKALLVRVGLESREHHRPAQLSGGECQRVAFVRALINSPALILADEPTGSLDSSSAEGLAGLLLDLNAEEGTTLIVVTHSGELAERMQRVVPIRDGRLDSTARAS